MPAISASTDPPECGRSFADRGEPRLVLAGELAEHRFEILRLAEIPVDGGEAHISDVVKRAQMLHHDLADRFGGNLGFAPALKLADNGRDHLLDPLRLNRALAQRDLHGSYQLVAIERHAAAVALHHGEFAKLHAFESGEAEVAGDADPPPPDHRGILGRTGVLDLRIEAVAAWTAHSNSSLIGRSGSGRSKPSPVP